MKEAETNCIVFTAKTPPSNPMAQAELDFAKMIAELAGDKDFDKPAGESRRERVLKNSTLLAPDFTVSEQQQTEAIAAFITPPRR